MALKAVLFDFDGVIADTDNHHIAAWQRTLSAMGWSITDDDAAIATEIDDRKFLADLFAKHDISSTKIEDWVRKKQELTVRMLRDSPRIYAGAAELIQALHGKVRLAVVTGTWRENAQAVLESAGLDGYFETIVSKQDVKSNKPDPEPYLLALERLDLAPSSAVAFEDSPTGASSARGAGVPLIAVGHRHPTGDWIGESPYIAGFTPIRAVLERLGLAAHPA